MTSRRVESLLLKTVSSTIGKHVHNKEIGVFLRQETVFVEHFPVTDDDWITLMRLEILLTYTLEDMFSR